MSYALRQRQEINLPQNWSSRVASADMSSYARTTQMQQRWNSVHGLKKQCVQLFIVHKRNHVQISCYVISESFVEIQRVSGTEEQKDDLLVMLFGFKQKHQCTGSFHLKKYISTTASISTNTIHSSGLYLVVEGKGGVGKSWSLPTGFPPSGPL